MRLHGLTFLFPFAITVAIAACSSDGEELTEPSTNEPDSGTQPQEDAGPDAAQPDQAAEASCVPGAPAATPIEVGASRAVIITSAALESALRPFAELHTMFGTPTEVVTLEEICGGTCVETDPKKDTARAIKNWLIGKPELRYVLLGGDIEVVPSRKVHDTYKNPFMQSYTYDEEFFTDYYFADLSEWDVNGDGVYAQDGMDHPDYRPELAVSRIPVSTAAEAGLYYQKLVSYLTSYNLAHVGECMLLSNVATQFAGIDIDGALYFEAEGRTASLLPQGCSTRKMYATNLAGAEKTTAAGELSAIEQGYNLIVHNGHGSVNQLTVEYTGEEPVTGTMLAGLKNSTYPIFLSCACEAGTFSSKDSAGEMLMNASQGGAIAYLGNTVIGLGLAGGVQLIDEMLRFIGSTDSPMLGDALLTAHAKVPETDSFKASALPIPIPVVDKSSYEWTQKSATMFGDILIPVWKKPVEAAPEISLKRTVTCEGSKLSVEVTPAMDGVVRLIADGKYYDVELAAGQGTIDVAGEPQSIEAGMVVPGRLYGHASASF